MAGKGKGATQAAGIALLVLGAAAGMWGYQESETLGNTVASTLGGGTSDEVLIAYALGAACAAIGAYLLLKR